jgi:hypothetical protein
MSKRKNSDEVLEARIAHRLAMIAALEAEIAELRKQQGKDNQ